MVAENCQAKVKSSKIKIKRNETKVKSNKIKIKIKQDAMGAYTSAQWLWVNCECEGIVRNDPNKYPYFSPFV